MSPKSFLIFRVDDQHVPSTGFQLLCNLFAQNKLTDRPFLKYYEVVTNMLRVQPLIFEYFCLHEIKFLMERLFFKYLEVVTNMLPGQLLTFEHFVLVKHHFSWTNYFLNIQRYYLTCC